MIDEKDNAAVTTQILTNNGGGGPVAPVVPIEATEANAEENELARLRQENAELRQQQQDRERDARIKAAVASAHGHHDDQSAGDHAIRRQRAIAQCKGVAYWYKIPIPDRVNILTDGQRVPATTEEISKYFGSKSSAVAATQLKASNHRAYHSYRAEAIELGLIG